MEVLAELLGESPGIVALRAQVGRVLAPHAGTGRLPPILIQGETGTGKGLVARAIHRAGPRARGPFVDVNCAAIPETLLEAEMFGYERGAFTDARQAKPGLFQSAHGGVIFLDEIGLLPLGLQAKLLKVIEERMVRRLGSTRSEPVDVWLLAATNTELTAAMREGRFREDLYHRLAVVTLTLPPLRARGADVLLLAERFLVRVCSDYRLPPKTLAPDARAALLAHAWPGNVRELGNVIERVALLSDTPLVTAAELGLAPGGQSAPPGSVETTPVRSLEDAVRDHLLGVLRQTAWNISRAAAILGVSRNTLRARIERHALEPPPVSPGRKGRARPMELVAGDPPASEPAAPVPAAPVPTAVRWERRRLTFVRVILDTAALPVAPTAGRALQVFVEKTATFGGTVEEMSPTGVVAVFGLDPAEDAPRRGAHAATAIRRAIHQAGTAAAAASVRVAIHVSQCLVGETSGRPLVDLDGKREASAALERLLSHAAAGEIVVSEEAVPFLDRLFALTPTAPHAGGAGRVYRLEGPGPTGFPRRLARFVGRDHDLEVLESRLASARRGHGQVVGIVGEAGIGKSRLLFEFRARVRRDGVAYLEGACRSYAGTIPYLPLVDVVRANGGIAEADGPEATAAKLGRAVGALAMDPETATPYLLRLLGVPEGTAGLDGLDPEAIRLRTLDILREMALRGSRQGVLVLAIEDLHWIDRTSEECLTALADSLAGAAILLVATHRPGFRPPWIDKSYATQIALQPLSSEESLGILRSALASARVPDRLMREILDRAEGNPFFLEELARAVGEQPTEDAPPAVPATIHEVLRARIGRLPDGARRTLQAASVLGRQVSPVLLTAIWQGPDDLGPHLRTLVRQEFLSERAGGAEPVYVFRHTLTQDVAYETLPPAERQALHGAAAGALEAAYPGRLDEVAELLAHHHARSADAAAAVRSLMRAADKAARTHAHAEAVAALKQALTHAGRLPPAEQDRAQVDLALRQAASLIPLGRFDEVRSLLPAHEPALARLEDPALDGRYHFLLGRTLSFLGEHERAAEAAERAIEAARQSGDAVTLGRALSLLALEGPLSGHALQGIEHGRQAVRLLEGTGERSWLGQAHWVLGLNYASTGEFAPALAAHAAAAAIGDAIGDRRLQTFAAWARGMIHAAMGEGDAGVEACRQALAHAPDPLNTAIARGWLGYARLERRDAGEAIPLLEAAARELGEFRFGQFHGWFTVFLAEARGQVAETAQATELAERGLAIMTAARFAYGTGWARRALGRIARACGALPEAEARLTEALQTFASIEARYELGRTHLDLAALAHARGDAAGAAAHLAEAGSRFTALGIPRYVARTHELAEAFGVPDSRPREP
jgi:transcriptional regulator with AAA-type ATPase domain/tetratricopeptide (TPR) repeat protein